MSTNGPQTRANHILVRLLSDLPAPVDGEHHLLDDFYYEFDGTITSAAAFQANHLGIWYFRII